MGNNWIDTVINEQYQFVRLLKRTDKTEICVFRHKELGKQIVKRTLKVRERFTLHLERFHTQILQMFTMLSKPKRESPFLKNMLTVRPWQIICKRDCILRQA